MLVLKNQWNGEPASDEVGFSISLSDVRLHFSVQLPATARTHPEAHENAFTPELWKWDVGELFLVGNSGRYIEINLAPNGAWWMQGFSDIRVPDKAFEVAQFSVCSDRCELSICAHALENYLGNRGEWRANVTAIIKSPDYEFLSLVTLPGDQADFHQPDTFAPVTEILGEEIKKD